MCVCVCACVCVCVCVEGACQKQLYGVVRGIRVRSAMREHTEADEEEGDGGERLLKTYETY